MSNKLSGKLSPKKALPEKERVQQITRLPKFKDRTSREKVLTLITVIAMIALIVSFALMMFGGYNTLPVIQLALSIEFISLGLTWKTYNRKAGVMYLLCGIVVLVLTIVMLINS